jgi:hypothetical protein
MRARIPTTVILLLTAVFLTPPAPAAAGWDDTGTTSVGSNSDGVKIVGLRYVARPDFERVVIRLRGPFPDYRTGYARRFHYEGSGQPVPIRGSSGLWVSFTADGHTQGGDNLYNGPRLARPRFDTLKALALTGDFEGQVTFAFALRHRATHRVFKLGESRLAIDFRHR